MFTKNSKIYVAGHNGLVGSAIVRELKRKGYKRIITASKKKLDLTNPTKTLQFLKQKKPVFIFIAAAKVGGIYSNNNFKADYIYQNLSIQSSLIHGAYLSGIKKIIFLGSSCVYPKNCKQPIKESYLMKGKLESTNDAYAIAKIAGIKMCQSYNEQYKTNYLSLMPTNTFGENDKYDELNSHFLPALIKKTHDLKINQLSKLKLWGNGLAKREAIHVDDLANACVYFMNKKTKHSIINIGTGNDYNIKYYANLMKKIILPNKKIFFEYDNSKPNGTPRKVLDVSLAKKYGWKNKINLKDAMIKTYKSYLNELKS
ncbi:GDP-L-fucose synthase [Candidatus Pelagibacter sp.]|jgi:GDP-L-fucose synthase|nr:GDP-L-fucose synthase [Candidatus Pelagibacter sp.]